MTAALKIAFYEDNDHLRQSLSALINLTPGLELMGSYPHANDILSNLKNNLPDVILMDIDMPGISGIDATQIIFQHYHDIKILILTVFDDDDRIFRAVCAGAVGYILKKSSPSVIIDAIFEAGAGGAPITPSVAVKILKLFKISNPAIPSSSDHNLSSREKEILQHLTKGLSYKMIADQCAISLDTVRYHIKNIYEKLHVHSMTEAVSKALKEKLI